MICECCGDSYLKVGTEDGKCLWCIIVLFDCCKARTGVAIMDAEPASVGAVNG